ncbi:hypothetical protein JXM67_00920 [candidate division WOR-3 bacterium]|nr:hypothetical protein [candidate division WOR-3 bacterium]
MSERNLWQEVTTWLTDATRTAVKETEELARKGRIKLDMLNVNKKIQETFSELGGVVYALIQAESRSIKTDTKVKELTERIKELEAKLDELKKEEESMKETKEAEKATKEKETDK